MRRVREGRHIPAEAVPFQDGALTQLLKADWLLKFPENWILPTSCNGERMIVAIWSRRRNNSA
jgi:hypothetical protein